MKNKLFITLALMMFAIGNAHAYDLMGLSPSHHILYLNILDAENHTVGVTYPCQGGSTYYYNHDMPEGDLIIPETLTIGSNTWTVVEIMDNAFYKCPITSVELPNTITAIGDYAFFECRFSSLDLPDAITTIGNWAFGHVRIQELTIPESVESVGDRAFIGCSLTSLALPEKDVHYGDGCFVNTRLVSVVLPEGLTTITPSMFLNCGLLTNVVFPSTLTSISADAFAYCTRLREIQIPSSVTVIGEGNNPFRGSQSVTSISVEEGNPVYYSEGNCLIERDTKTLIVGCRNSVIPNDVVAIGKAAFERGMEGPLCLPASVTSLGESAFFNCPSINKIYSYNPIPPTMCVQNEIQHSFAHVSRNIPVYVPTGCVEVYRNAPGWDEFPNIFEMGLFPQGAEWYYEILGDDGSITYQYLEYASDTTVNHKTVVVIIRTNTLYDKDGNTEASREYLYEEDGVVYWWNPTLGEFTTLYNFHAEEGDEWEIKVGEESLTMHVDEVLDYEYEGQIYRMLRVSDPEDIFSGDIICEIGHMTSFFPERLMTRGKGYQVEGIRCFWQFGQLVFKQGDMGCDEVHSGHYWAVDEQPDDAAFTIYPNPTHGALFVETVCTPSLPTQTYRITNLMGQTVQTGNLTAETQQINVSALPKGMYFISVGDVTQKFVVNK